MSLPELVLAGMPLGNSDDVTIRFLSLARSADAIICESRRTAQSLLKRHGIVRPDDDFLILDEHSTEEDIQDLTQRVSELKQVLLVSDAGMPVFCDPGSAMLVKAEQLGWKITVLPGASALTLAVVRAGIHGAFFFAGFPPREAAERRSFFQGLSRRKETVIFYETPYRLPRTLDEMKQVLSGGEKVFVGIDLSGENERVFRFRLKEAGRVAKQIPKGAPVIILDREKSETDEIDVRTKKTAFRAADRQPHNHSRERKSAQE